MTLLSMVESLGVGSMIVSVWLATRHARHTWSTGMVSCACYALLAASAQLYGAALLQTVGVLQSLWGWQAWGTELRPARRGPWTMALWTLGGTLVLLASVALLSWGGSRAPWAEGFLAAATLYATDCLARAERTAWLWWIAIDLVTASLFWQAELPMSAALFLGLAGLAAHGWRQWTPTTQPEALA